MKDKIIDFVTRGDLAAAALLLPEPMSTHQLGRIHKVSRDAMIGILSYAEEEKQWNVIRHAILSCAGLTDSDIIKLRENKANKEEDLEGTLRSIMILNKRRRPEIAQEARALLVDLREYKDNKLMTPGYDPAGEIMQCIKDSVQALQRKIGSAQAMSAQDIHDRITSLLSPIVPGYASLTEAYALASARGMRDPHVESILSNQPDDDEAKIRVAEMIELFMSRIEVV